MNKTFSYVKKTIKEKDHKLINAYVIKSACQSYFRSQGFLVCNEATYGTGYRMDVLMIEQKQCTSPYTVPVESRLYKVNKVWEVEVKCSKNDLTKLEVNNKKEKHEQELKEGTYTQNIKYAFGKGTEKIKDIANHEPDVFYFCVPTSLVKDALEVVNKLNPKYGVMEFIENCQYKDKCIRIIRRAKSLLDEKDTNLERFTYFQRVMLHRLSNEITTIYNDQFWNNYVKELHMQKVSIEQLSKK